jgi:25S rRNA (adenine(2142)-N(1))-methyltransferase, Bmt2
MGTHRKTIRRKKPLTHDPNPKRIKRKEAISRLHTDLKKAQNPSIPLSIYQNASSKGQDIQRGGDSSGILVKWLKQIPFKTIKILEIGSLEADNSISKYIGGFEGCLIRRIDLNSRDPRIEQEDFMKLSISCEVCTFLVLVVNLV